jgi:hypothetical protein
MSDTKTLAAKILKRKPKAAETTVEVANTSSLPAAQSVIVTAPVQNTKVDPVDGWPRRLARLGIQPATQEERAVPGWVERRSVIIRKAFAEERQRRLAEHTPIPPPVRPEDLTDVIVIEGKKVVEWAAEYDALSAAKKPDDYQPHKSMPGWATWAVQKWRERGAPTAKAIAKSEYETLTEKADGALELALLKEKQAKEATSEKEKLALTKAAQKQRERHEKLVADASVVAQKLKAEQP